MPRLISNVNSTGAIGISSDGTSLGDITSLNYDTDTVEFDSKAGVATITSRIGISSDGTSLGDVNRLNYSSNTVEFDSNAGVATIMTNPLTIIGL